MAFLNLLLLGALVYLAWRVVDQMPDIVFRLGEIQRDIAELRRQQDSADIQAIAKDAPPPPPG